MGESYIRLPADSVGKKTRTIAETIGADEVHTQFITYRQMPTYFAGGVDIVPGTNAHLITILNRHNSKVVRLWRVNVYISSDAAVTGVFLKMQALRVTATATLSGGTAVTAVLADKSDPALSSIDIMTKPTSTLTADGILKTFFMSGDEALVSTLDADTFSSQMFPRDGSALICPVHPLVKPITLRPQVSTFEGFSIQNLVGTVGNVGLELAFTVTDE